MSSQTTPGGDVPSRVELVQPSGDETGTAPGDRAFRPDIEGLRAVAVLLVVSDHALQKGFRGGYIGVDVFFVISGFVITGLLLRERTGTGRLALMPFYARRARRIIPAAVLVLVVALIAERLLIGGSVVPGIASQARFASVFLANAPNQANNIFMPTPFNAYWSLAVEEQFYVVYPALFIGVCALGRRSPLRLRLSVFLALVIVLSFSWSVVSSPGSLYAYVSPLTRAWELAVGALLAVGTTQLKRIPVAVAALATWVGLIALIVMGKTFVPSASGYPGWHASFPVLAAALVVGGGTVAPRYGAEVLLRTPPFKWVGRWSYSIYLWHVPFLALAAQYWGPRTAAQNVLLCAVAVGVSAATYFWIENPIRHSKFLTRSPAASLALGATLIAVCVVITFLV